MSEPKIPWHRSWYPRSPDRPDRVQAAKRFFFSNPDCTIRIDPASKLRASAKASAGVPESQVSNSAYFLAEEHRHPLVIDRIREGVRSRRHEANRRILNGLPHRRRSGIVAKLTSLHRGDRRLLLDAHCLAPSLHVMANLTILLRPFPYPGARSIAAPPPEPKELPQPGPIPIDDPSQEPERTPLGWPTAAVRCGREEVRWGSALKGDREAEPRRGRPPKLLAPPSGWPLDRSVLEDASHRRPSRETRHFRS